MTTKVDLDLEYDQDAASAAAEVLRKLLDAIEANLDGAIEGTDPEFLHDFRVAIRRSRSVQRQLHAVFPEDELGHFRMELRWLQRATGEARDLDVHVLQFDECRAMVPSRMRADLEPVLAALSERLMSARRQLVAVLRSDRASVLLSDWAAFVDELRTGSTDGRPAAERPIGELAGKRIRKVYGRMLRMGRAIGSSSPPGDFHELRKAGKELRYLLELFAVPLYPGDVVKPMVKTLKGLQDVLGHHQDREVQVATLRSLPEQVAGRPGGAAALMTMGVLLDRLLEDERTARGEFAKRFGRFASPSQRKLVKATFP
jgi:CHAD domain-containing protein